MPEPTVVVRGTGSIGVRHLRVLRDRLGLRPVAMPVRQERREALEREGFETVADLADVGRRAPVFSIVATDTARHLGDASELLAFGPVLVEKPLAATSRSLDDFTRARPFPGHRVAVGYCLRFSPSLHAFRDQMSRLGHVHAVRIESQSYLPDWRPARDYHDSYSGRVDEGGVLRDLSHEIDYAVWLFGRPGSIFATVERTGRLGIDVDDSAEVCWRTPLGALLSLRVDYLTRVARRRMLAFGSEGTLMWDALLGTVTLEVPGRDAEIVVQPSTADDWLAAQAHVFLGQSAGPLATLDEGAFVVKVIDAAFDAARAGAWQPVAH